MERSSKAVSKPINVLKEAEEMGRARSVGSDLEGVSGRDGRAEQDRLGTSVLGWNVCSLKKRGLRGLSPKGKGCKVMLVTDGQGIPLGVLVTPSNKAEVSLAEGTLAHIRVGRLGRGRPRTNPHAVVADRAYDSQRLRIALQARGIRPCIPHKKNARPRRGPKTNRNAYRDRWHIERTFAWLGSFRRLVVRYDRFDSTFSVFLKLACSLLCLRALLK